MAYSGGWRRLQEAKDSQTMSCPHWTSLKILSWQVHWAQPRAVGMTCESHTHKGEMFQELSAGKVQEAHLFHMILGMTTGLTGEPRYPSRCCSSGKGSTVDNAHTPLHRHMQYTHTHVHICAHAHTASYGLYSTLIALACMPSTRS